MQNNIINQLKADRWLYAFIFIHLLSWALIPALVRYNLPLDAIEGTIWGHQLEWGYDKNPFMNGWLTALATYLDGRSGWMVYLFSQLSVAACFWAVWQIAKTMLSPAYALISILILEGVQYYNFHAIDFNDNTLELGLWALTIYYFYLALRFSGNLNWVLTGLFAGFGMMAKYYTASLLASMFLFLLYLPENRRQFSQRGFYLAFAVFLAISLPHIVWLFFHDFITITYVFERTSSEPNWTNHFFFPAQFAWQQIEVFLPALLLFAFAFIGKKPTVAERPALTEFNRSFLLFVGLGPFVLTLLLSIVLGIKLRAGWGMPLLSFWGVLLVASMPPSLTAAKLKRFASGVFVVMGLLLSVYSASLIYSSGPSSANFPGQEIADNVTQMWREKFNRPLAYVAGSRWLSGNIEFYSPDRPAVFIEWDKRRSPWINVEAMKKHGAVFVWNISNDETLPEPIKNRFANLSAPIVKEFAYKRSDKNKVKIKIGMAFLPPA